MTEVLSDISLGDISVANTPELRNTQVVRIMVPILLILSSYLIWLRLPIISSEVLITLEFIS